MVGSPQDTHAAVGPLCISYQEIQYCRMPGMVVSFFASLAAGMVLSGSVAERQPSEAQFQFGFCVLYSERGRLPQ